jgi:hypothetical protein
LKLYFCCFRNSCRTIFIMLCNSYHFLFYLLFSISYLYTNRDSRETIRTHLHMGVFSQVIARKRQSRFEGDVYIDNNENMGMKHKMIKQQNTYTVQKKCWFVVCTVTGFNLKCYCVGCTRLNKSISSPRNNLLDNVNR